MTLNDELDELAIRLDENSERAWWRTGQLPELIIDGADPTAAAKKLAILFAERSDFLFDGHGLVRVAIEGDSHHARSKSRQRVSVFSRI